MALNGYSEDTFGYNTVIKNGELPDANDVKAVVPPIGAIIPWAKTFASADSGTTDGVAANKLIDAGQNFLTTVAIGYVIHNSTDDTFTYVTAVDDNENLSINDDIFISGEAYTIYKTPYLSDAWAECDGSVLSDSDSPFDGATLPDLNATQSFARGNITSGTTGGADTHSLSSAELPSHLHTFLTQTSGGGGGGQFPEGGAGGGGNVNTSSVGSGTAHENMPVFYEVVFIMRVK